MHLSKISFLKSFLVVAFVFSLLSFFSFKEVNSELIYNGQFPGVQVSTGGSTPCGELNSEDSTAFDAASMEACEQGGDGGEEYIPPEPPEPPIVTPGVSDSVTVYVVPEGENPENTTKGLITAEKDSCIIEDGKNTCDVKFTWSVTNPDPEKVATVKRAPIAGPVINQNSGSQILPVYYWLDSVFNTNRYILFIDKVYTRISDGVRVTENGKILSQAFVKATCKDGSSWVSSLAQCVKNVSVKKFSASNCTIPTGSSVCTSNISWETVGGYGSFAVTTPNNITVATAKTGTANYSVSYPSRDFYLYNNGNELATSRSYADCEKGSGWSLIEKKCVKTVIPPEECTNGATNPPTCNICAVGSTYNSSLAKCVCNNGATNSPECTDFSQCTNGATNYPDCDDFKCTNGATNYPDCDDFKCTNGATNYPDCNTCGAGTTLNTSTNKCECDNGASNPSACNTCGAGTSLNPATNKCECINGAFNPQTCDPNFLKFEVKDCLIPDGEGSCQTSLNWSTLATGSFAITTPENITVSSALSGKDLPYKVEYPSRTFYAYNNGNELAAKTARASCTGASLWDPVNNKCVSNLVCPLPTERTENSLCPEGQVGQIVRKQTKDASTCEFPSLPMTESNSTLVSDSCKPQIDPSCGPKTCEYELCEGDPTQQINCTQICGGEVISTVTFCPPAEVNPLNIDFKSSANRVLLNKSVKLTWTSDADECVADSSKAYFETGNSANGSKNVAFKQAGDFTFGIICKKGEITDSKEVTVKVNTISIIEN